MIYIISHYKYRMRVPQNEFLVHEALFFYEIKYIFIISTMKRSLSYFEIVCFYLFNSYFKIYFLNIVKKNLQDIH